MLEIEPTKYDSILDKVIAVLNGENIIDAIGVDMSSTSTSMPGTENVNIGKLIKTILNGISISSTGIDINIDAKELGFDGYISASVIVKNGEVAQIVLNKFKINDIYLDVNMNMAQEDKLLPEFTEEQEQQYLNVAQTVDTVEKV